MSMRKYRLNRGAALDFLGVPRPRAWWQCRARE